MRFQPGRRTLIFVGAPVFLCGMMGAGKSAVGRRLAAMLDVAFVDLDARTERMFGTTIADAFARGEPYFRGLERTALQSLVAEPAFAGRTVIVATGGGLVVDPNNRACMDGVGTRVLLRVPPEQLAERLQGAEAARRPLVAEADDPVQRLRELWQARREAYEAGAAVVDGVGSVDVVAQRVRDALDLQP